MNTEPAGRPGPIWNRLDAAALRNAAQCDRFDTAHGYRPGRNTYARVLRLEAAGLVTPHGLGYRLTEAGRAALAAWDSTADLRKAGVRR